MQTPDENMKLQFNLRDFSLDAKELKNQTNQQTTGSGRDDDDDGTEDRIRFSALTGKTLTKLNGKQLRSVKPPAKADVY